MRILLLYSGTWKSYIKRCRKLAFFNDDDNFNEYLVNDLD